MLLQLQWGRSCSERKTRCGDRCPDRQNNGFNGAALVQSGRPGDPPGVLPLGPQLLQWGRSCSERKTKPISDGGRRSSGLQWGRSCSERKTPQDPLTSPPPQSLQWGRSCSERKTDSAVGSQPGTQRFNGAALVQSGRPYRNEWCLNRLHASMGPLLFRAEDAARWP